MLISLVDLTRLCVLSRVTIQLVTVAIGRSLRAADQHVGGGTQAWSEAFPVPAVRHEKGIPLNNCTTPLKSFTDAIPGQLQGYNIRCVDGLAQFGHCVNDHLLLDNVEDCASVCLAFDACMSL
jgi:hypothetical protein